jgi:hypothetical protein
MPPFTVAQEIRDFAVRCVLPDPPDSIPNGVKIGVNAGMTQLRQQLAGRSRSSGRRTTKFVIDSTGLKRVVLSPRKTGSGLRSRREHTNGAHRRPRPCQKSQSGVSNLPRRQVSLNAIRAR